MPNKQVDIAKNLISAADFLEQRDTWLIALWAQTGFGKSSFILSAPKPIYILSLEPKSLMPALRRMIARGIIRPDEVFIDEVIRSALMTTGESVPSVRTLAENQEIYYYINDQIEYILADPNSDGGTIGIDTGTEYWAFCDEVESEEITEKRQKQGKDLYRFDFQYANKAMKSVIDNIASSNMNAVFTHHAKPVYNSKGEEQRGRYDYHGNKHLHKWVDILIRLRLEVKDGTAEDDDPIVDRWAVVEKCRLDQKLLGEEFNDPTWDTTLDLMIPNDWSV